MHRLIYKSRSILVEVDIETINDIVERSKELNRRNEISGALVARVEMDSTAHEAGLFEGDVIVEVNHRKMEDAKGVVEASERARDDKILLRVWTQRGGRPGLVYIAVDNTSDE